MTNIKLIADSACDIPKELTKQYDISVLPMGINIDGKTYFDGVDFENREYAKMLRTMDSIPTTSMVPVTKIKEEFLKNLDDYQHQIFIAISSKSSGTYNVANMVKQEIEEELGKKSNITVLDSMLFTMLYGKIILNMAKLAQQGAGYEQVINAFYDEQQSSGAFFIVDDLMHLQKGGRIKPGVAVIGALLGIKPILTVNDGLVDMCGRERGKHKAIGKIVELSLAAMGDPSETALWIANCDADEDVATAVEMLKSKATFKEITEFELGACISTHSGAGLTGIIF